MTAMNAAPGVEAPSAHKLGVDSPQGPDTRGGIPAPGVTVVAGAIAPNGRLYVTVQGPTITSVQSLGARTLAYNERFKHGMGQAGIESGGAAFPCNEDGSALLPSREQPKLWRHTFVLRAG